MSVEDDMFRSATNLLAERVAKSGGEWFGVYMAPEGEVQLYLTTTRPENLPPPPWEPSEPSFYSCSEDTVRLTSVDPEEAITDWLDQVPRDEWPETLKVFGWRRLRVKAASWEAERALELLLESLDEEYGDPDGDSTEPTDAMKAAAAAFVATVAAEYQLTSWPHEIDPEYELEVNVLEWVTEYAPEWLKPDNFPDDFAR